MEQEARKKERGRARKKQRKNEEEQQRKKEGMKEVQEDRNMGRTTTDGAMQRELAGAEDGAAGEEIVDTCNCGWVFGLRLDGMG